MSHATAYCRLSDKDSSHNSIKNQIKKVEEYCERNNLTLLKTFIDDGKSGWTFDRPGFIELEKFCKQNRSIQYLIIPHFDRFSRADPIDAMVKERYFRDKLNVKVLQVSEPIDTDTNNPTYQIVRFMQAFAANEERNRIVDRTISGMRYSLMQGRYCSSAPIGYKNSRDENNRPLLLIDEEKAPAIKLIFSQFAKGINPEQIRRNVKEKGIDLKGKSAIQRILSNPVYAGLINVPAYKNLPPKIVKGIHAPIVTESIFYETMEKLSGKKHRFHPSDQVPIRGFIRCHCGRHLTAAPSKGKTGKYYWYYFCESHRKTNHSATKLHTRLDNILDALSLKKENLAAIKKTLTEKLQIAISEQTKALMQVNLNIQKTERMINDAEEKYLLNEVSDTTFKKVIKEKRILLQSLQDQRANLQTEAHEYLSKIDLIMDKASRLKEVFNEMDINGKQTLLKQVFEKICVDTDGTFRTPFLNPLFSIKPATALALGLIIEKAIAPKNETIALSAPEGGWHEILNGLFKIFAA